ncbi:MAG: hypothetical protein PHH85_01565 [Candidatus Methanoperedens sp.]|nr:hypothetical protein [Candidatus Methanoperedens sp.]
MTETKTDSGADFQDLQEVEFHKIMDMSIEELMEKAWAEQWKVKHIVFWLDIKKAQNFEKMLILVRDRLEALYQPVII